MGIQVYSEFFKSLEEALEDVKRSGTWPTTFVSGPSAGLHKHWHAHDVHAYIMEGETDFLDGTTGSRTAVRAGDKVTIPARTLHAEGAVKDRVVYLLALPEPVPADQFLAMHDPGEL